MNRVKSIKRAGLVTLLAATAVAAGCGPSGLVPPPGGSVMDVRSVAETPTTATPSDRITAVAGAAPAGGALSAASRQAQPAPPANSSLPPSPARLGCPILVANPVGCPIPGPQPLRPPVAQLRIMLCGTALTVCGGGFPIADRLVLLVIGRSGTITIPIQAGANGTIRVVVPSSVCRVAPLMIVIRDDRGEGSNAIPVPAFACRMR